MAGTSASGGSYEHRGPPRRSLRRVVKGQISRVPIVGSSLIRLAEAVFSRRRIPFFTSAQYWEDVYAQGGHSGEGSYNEPAEFKASFLNQFVRDRSIESIIESGSGDGAQLRRANYPRYIGVDVSHTAIKLCRKIFADDKTKIFFLANETPDTLRCAELALSLDVVYHLVEDDVYNSYMNRLFESATRFVVIYGWDVDRDSPKEKSHVRHRAFVKWAREHAKHWALASVVTNRDPRRRRGVDFANFYVFQFVEQ
jgi:hypothetical protein